MDGLAGELDDGAAARCDGWLLFWLGAGRDGGPEMPVVLYGRDLTLFFWVFDQACGCDHALALSTYGH